MSRHEPLGLHVGTSQRGAKLGPRLVSVCIQSISISSPATDPGAVVVVERGRTPQRRDGPNYWPVNPRDLPLPAGWARGCRRSRGCSPGTMSPKRAVGSISIWLLCSVNFFLLVVHARASLVCARRRFLQSAACTLLLCPTTPSPRSQHMLKHPRIGDVGARPCLAQTMLNFLHLGESRFLLMIVLSSLAPSRPRLPPNTPTRPPNPIAIAPRPSTCR